MFRRLLFFFLANRMFRSLSGRNRGYYGNQGYGNPIFGRTRRGWGNRQPAYRSGLGGLADLFMGRRKRSWF